MNRKTLDRIKALQDAKRAAVLVTDLEDGNQRLVENRGVGELDQGLRGVAEQALARDVSLIYEEGERRMFVQPFNPPLRLIVVGAVHISQPLLRIASVLGFDVTLVDPREAWTDKHRFPEGDVTLSDEWPDEALEELGLDHRSAVVVLTHDPKLDDPALQVALRSPAFYVGALGSKKTHRSRIRRLRNAGLEDPALARIAGPIGLPIGSKNPQEIALAIMAEVVQALRRGFEARPLPEG
ncbi:MAG: XdhC family protein [Myxococcota bacterium]